MAANPINRSQHKQILRLASHGYSLKGIVRETGVARNTVKGYLRTIEAREINLEAILTMEDPRVEHLMLRLLKSKNNESKILFCDWKNYRWNCNIHM